MILDHWPAKRKKQNELIEHVATHFEAGRKYTEPEVNEVIQSIINFEDFVIVRRMLFGLKYLDRTLDGRRYWVRES